MYRIGRSEDRSVAPQVVVPLTCGLLSAIPIADVPRRFLTIRTMIPDMEVTREKYILELRKYLHLIPDHLRVNSDLLSPMVEETKRTMGDLVRTYVLAYLVPLREAYVAVADPKPTDDMIRMFLGLCRGAIDNRSRARDRIDRILCALIHHELRNRFFVLARGIDVGFTIPLGNEHVILALTHYHPPFVAKFRRIVDPFVRSEYMDRVQDLVRSDFNIFACALSRVPATGSEATKRLESILFPKGHPESGRIVWCYCSIWFDTALLTFRSIWNLPHETLRRMWTLAVDPGLTMDVLEATTPFGSQTICSTSTPAAYVVSA